MNKEKCAYCRKREGTIECIDAETVAQFKICKECYEEVKGEKGKNI